MGADERAVGAVLVALVLAAGLLTGGRDGSFHTVRAVATPTVATAGLGPAESRAEEAEKADLDRLAATTATLLLLAALAVAATVAGAAAAENLVLEGRRSVEVMLGAPPALLAGGAARAWGRRGAWACLAGGGGCAVATVAMVGSAPPGVWFERPAAWPWVVGLGAVVVLGLAVGVLPVVRLYRRAGPLATRAENAQVTDPRPRQFDRKLRIVLQLAAATGLLAASGLMRSRETGGVAAATVGDVAAATAGEGAATTVGSGAVRGAVVAILDAARETDIDLGAALAAIEAAPRFRAASLGTPGAWTDRGPEATALNECGRCTAGGMPHPFHTAQVVYHAVVPGFFRARRLLFVAGEGFAAGPTGGAGEVVINAAYARAHFQDPPVIGRQVALGGLNGEWHVVTGVVEDVTPAGLGASASPYTVYYSALEHPTERVELVAEVVAGANASATREPTTKGPEPEMGDELAPTDVQASLQNLVYSAGATVGPVVSAAGELRRLNGTAAWLGGGSLAAGLLAAVATVLGAVGSFRAYVASRRREMAVRSALGAAPETLRRLVYREVLGVAGAGAGLGLFGTVLLVALAAPPGTPVVEWRLFLMVAGAFFAAAAAAAAPGARLAASAEPGSALRS